VPNRLRKAFRTTKVTVDAFPTDVHEKLEQLYINYEGAKTDAVAAERAAGIAVNNAQSKRAKAQAAELELLTFAATHNNQIAGERVWIPYKNKDQKLVFEGFTDRLIRNAQRAQLENMGKSLSENSDDDNTGMYEDGEDETGENA
jgi:hypothetical protein